MGWEDYDLYFQLRRITNEFKILRLIINIIIYKQYFVRKLIQIQENVFMYRQR